ncbi:MAG TPA: PilZ domain-containing protein [Candidatus Angelobacter sp.]|nr:PilZ domain-containing protein [Candidatus Angelobacter sp.]
MPLPTHTCAAGNAGLLVPAERSFRYTTNISVLAALLINGKERRLPQTVLRNISCTGAGITSSLTLPLGENISLHFYLPDSGKPFRALAKVIWSDSHGHCGVEFQQVSEEHFRRLKSWLATKLSERQTPALTPALPLGSFISETRG